VVSWFSITVGVVLLCLSLFIISTVDSWCDKIYKGTKHELLFGDLLTDEEYKFLKENSHKFSMRIFIVAMIYVPTCTYLYVF
jgi:hypothetical protein